MNLETSKGEILEAIQEFSSSMDRQLGEFRSEFGGVKSEVGNLKSELISIKSQMVTKSYLDDKLGGLKGDMVSMLRKEDQKVNRLVTVLAEKRVLTSAETKDVLSFRPFP